MRMTCTPRHPCLQYDRVRRFGTKIGKIHCSLFPDADQEVFGPRLGGTKQRLPLLVSLFPQLWEREGPGEIVGCHAVPAICSWWMLREIEASALAVEDVRVDRVNKRVDGFSADTLSCPFHTVFYQLHGAVGTVSDHLPLFPKFDRSACNKEHMVAVVEWAAKCYKFDLVD
eukprot:3399142-Amphidinium_carterae.1